MINLTLILRRLAFCFFLALPMLAGDLHAQIVPGTGRKLQKVGDDFEAEDWKYVPKPPKASREQDGQARFPTGYSTNRRWYESPKRGQPDTVRIVPTPAGGPAGSKQSLLLRSLATGRPGLTSNEMQQDDFIMACASRVGIISTRRTPSCVVRVYLPPFEEWENRTGSHFGVRADLRTTKVSFRKRFLLGDKRLTEAEAYWPGFFIQFHSRTDSRFKEDSAVLLIRGDQYGHEIRGPAITQTGWWTMGMSFTPDGRVHFYASPGVDRLTAADYITSSLPYGYNAENFATMFFNSVNWDDGRTWSTSFIIDDAEVFVLR